MARVKEREHVVRAYYLYMLVRELLRRHPSSKHTRHFKRLYETFKDDIRVIRAIQGTRYLNPRSRVP